MLADAGAASQVELLAPAAMVEHGDGFAITASYGAVPSRRRRPLASDALLIADQRMYAQKNSGRATARRQSTDVLLRALAERHPGLEGHLGGVAHLAERWAATSASRARRSTTSGWPPSSTTWARSPSPTRSSTSQAR